MKWVSPDADNSEKNNESHDSNSGFLREEFGEQKGNNKGFNSDRFTNNQDTIFDLPIHGGAIYMDSFIKKIRSTG